MSTTNNKPKPTEPELSEPEDLNMARTEAESEKQATLLGLPIEVLQSVFEHLPFTQRVQAWNVSRDMVRKIRGSGPLWWNLDLRSATASTEVPASFISTAIDAGKKFISRASLHHVEELERMLPVLLRKCEKLATLECWVPSPDTFTLRGLQCNNLTDLTVYANSHLAFWNFFKNIDQAVPNLRSLKVRNEYHWLGPRIARIDLENLTKLLGIEEMGYLSFPPSLRSLRLDSVARCDRTVQFRLPNLTTLWIHLREQSGAALLVPMFLGEGTGILDGAPLEVLGVWNSCHSVTGLRRLFSHSRLQSLVHLTLRKDSTDRAEWVDALTELSENDWLPKLESIDLSGCDLNQDGFMALASLKQLKRIVVNECTRLGKNAVHGARVKFGKSVQAKTSEETYKYRLWKGAEEDRCRPREARNHGDHDFIVDDDEEPSAVEIEKDGTS
ncbi:hypothetical protein LTR22_026216 [Elasticomyces elasticus]|nr:hypothetical protein LTR22_026216 [Elasticomyces elasticus]